MLEPVAISAESIWVDLNEQKVLSDLSFSISKGEVFALLGGNGAGKSTTLKTFLGLVKPTAGRACIFGDSVHDNLVALRNKIAYLPESVMLYGHLTAKENIDYFLSLGGVSCSKEEINQALETVSLQSKSWSQLLANYSKGMRQKTAIALAILRKAPILLLDEPTSGLDPRAIDEFNQLVSERAKEGTTVFMVTHDVYGACQVANKISLLAEGELVGTYETPEIGHINTEDVHAAFLGRV